MPEWSTVLAGLVDHTLLRPDATGPDARAVVDQADVLGAYSVFLSPSRLPVKPARAKVTAVCGFPSGAHSAAVKAAEAHECVALGADEIDMVVNLGLVKDGDFEGIRREIAAVREQVVAPAVLKVIIESAALTDDQIIDCCRTAVEAGADFVKTSTGFHPAGGASIHAVALMRRTVGDKVGVKASGGIRTAAQAFDMVAAGANRLGMSATAQTVNEDFTPTEAQLSALQAARPR